MDFVGGLTTLQCSLQDPNVARLFQRVTGMREQFEEQIDEIADASEDMEAGFYKDAAAAAQTSAEASAEALAEASEEALAKASEKASETPMQAKGSEDLEEPETPVLILVTPNDKIGRYRSIPSLLSSAPTLELGEHLDPPPTPAALPFQPPADMSPSEQEELGHLLAKLQELELMCFPQ